MSAAANYYLRAVFFSGLKKKRMYFLTFAVSEVHAAETGCVCLHVAAKANTNPSEGEHYVTIIFQLPQQTVTCTFNQTTLGTVRINTLYFKRKPKVFHPAPDQYNRSSMEKSDVYMDEEFDHRKSRMESGC